jgi:hypothetical protein
MGLKEATHLRWGEPEPHLYFRGTEPIDGVWFSPNLEVISTVQLFFHKRVGDHRSVLVDITTKLAIGKQEFRENSTLMHADSAPGTSVQGQNISPTWRTRC